MQTTDSAGIATFTAVVPGCYPGRIPHVHLEVYPSLAKATDARNAISTTQFTFPMAMLKESYATPGYGESVRRLAEISHATDFSFSDGLSRQMVAVSGNTRDGYVATLQVGIATGA